MKPKEYEKNVLITESNDFAAIHGRIDDKMIRLLHAGLGLSSELTELADAIEDPKDGAVDWVNVYEESGDLAWYVAVAVNTLGFDHDEISSHEADASDHVSVLVHSMVGIRGVLLAITWGVGNYNDLLKKHIFYGRELNTEKIKETLQQICMAISGICLISGVTAEEARQTNINKLRARFGEKFTQAAALNRDLDTERKILEGEKS